MGKANIRITRNNLVIFTNRIIRISGKRSINGQKGKQPQGKQKKENNDGGNSGGCSETELESCINGCPSNIFEACVEGCTGRC